VAAYEISHEGLLKADAANPNGAGIVNYRFGFALGLIRNLICGL
jgi:hypothetical protein